MTVVIIYYYTFVQCLHLLIKFTVLTTFSLQILSFKAPERTLNLILVEEARYTL